MPVTDFSLAGKVAIVTGGSRGIGRSIAIGLAEAGADVAIAARKPEALEEAKAAVEATGRRCLTLQGDLTDPDFCQEVVDRTVEEFGQLDILVSNAAWQNRKDSLDQVSEEEWDRTFKTNVYAMFWICKAALEHLPPGASIINTASIQSYDPSAILADYAPTKAAIVAFTKALAKQVKAAQIHTDVMGSDHCPVSITLK